MAKMVWRELLKSECISYSTAILIDWMDYKAAEKAKAHMQVPVKVIRIPYGGKDYKIDHIRHWVNVVCIIGHHMYLDNPDEFNNVMLEELTADDAGTKSS